MKTDSFFEEDSNEENNMDSNTLIFKIKFSELSNVFEMVQKFCYEYKIRKTDEYSFVNYIIVTVETEKLSHEGSLIVNDIQTQFDVDKMLHQINKNSQNKVQLKKLLEQKIDETFVKIAD